MTTRRILDPDSVQASFASLEEAAAAFEELREAVVDIFQYSQPFIQVVTADFTVPDSITNMMVLCNNTTDITVTLTDSPIDLNEVIVKRANTGKVTVAGNGKNIDGDASLVIPLQYDSPHLLWSDTLGEWSIV